MKAWIPRGIRYYTVFPSQGPDIFWLYLQKIVEATLWAWTGSGKEHETESKGAGHNFWKNDKVQGRNIKPIKIKWVQDDKSNVTKPWSPVCKLNDTQRWQGSSKAPKMEEWVVPQWLGWSSHSLAYELIQLAKTSHTTFHGWSTCPLQSPTPCGVCFCLNPNKSINLTYRCVSNWIFAMRHESLSFITSWSQAPWILARLKVLGERSWKTGGKISGKTCQGLPFINCQKIC